MKTVLDFSKVPLDKWVDLYNICEGKSSTVKDVLQAAKDISKLASVQVKTEEDYNKEIVEAIDSSNGRLTEETWALINKRREVVRSELPATQPAEDVIK